MENANTATKFYKKSIRIPKTEEFEADSEPVDVCRELFHKTWKAHKAFPGDNFFVGTFYKLC